MDGEIDVAELVELQAGQASTDGTVDEELRIVDIRTSMEFDRAHIPNSENIPFAELTTRVPELDGADRIVTVCPHGISSRQAAQLVASYAGAQDARVESLRGGLEAWEREEGLVRPETASGEADEGPDAPF